MSPTRRSLAHQAPIHPSSPHSRCQPPCMSVLPTQPIHPSIQPTHAAHPSHPSSPAQSSPCAMRAIVPCAPSCHSYHVAPSFAPSLIVLVSPGLLQTCLNIHAFYINDNDGASMTIRPNLNAICSANAISFKTNPLGQRKSDFAPSYKPAHKSDSMNARVEHWTLRNDPTCVTASLNVSKQKLSSLHHSQWIARNRAVRPCAA